MNSVTRLSQRGTAGALEIAAATAAVELGIARLSRSADVGAGLEKLNVALDAMTFGGGGGGGGRVGISKPGDVEACIDGVPLILSVISKFAMTVGPPRKVPAVGLAPYV